MFEVIFKVVVVLLALYGVVRILFERDRHEKEAALLWVLQHGGIEKGMYALDLAKITGISQFSIYQRLERLEQKELIRVSRDQLWPFRYRYHFVPQAAHAALRAADQAP